MSALLWATLGSSFAFVAAAGAAIWLLRKGSAMAAQLVSATAATSRAEKEAMASKLTADGLLDANKLLAAENDRLRALAAARSHRIEKLEELLADTSTPAAARARLDELLSKANLPGADSDPGDEGT